MLYGKKMLFMVNIVHKEAYMSVLSGKERAQILAGRRKEGKKSLPDNARFDG